MSGINIKDVKISFGGTELTKFDGKLEISKPNPSLVEEQVECMYCQGVTARWGFASDDYKYATFFERDENKFTFGLAHPDGYTPLGKFRINYCPFCGRKLAKIYMIAGGSVGPYDMWWIIDKDGNRKNLVDEGVAVECYFDPFTHTYQPVK